MSTSFMDTFFGPLSKEFCLYFYAISIITGISFVLTALSMVYFMVTNIKKIDMELILSYFMSLTSLFLAYLVNRLFHTMCINSL